MKFFGSSDSTAQDSAAAQRAKLTRRSSSLAQLIKTLDSEETLYSDDLLISSTDPSLVIKDEAGKPTLDSKRFLEENLVYPGAEFDIVLCWNLPDYLDESLVKPVVGRLWSLLKPGGMLLAFFHTQEAGPDAPCYRYHIVGGDVLEMQHINRGDGKKGAPAGKFRLQRVFNNRNIENLFRDFASIKFFLARDNIREVLFIR